MNKILCAGGSVFLSERTRNLSKKILKLKETFETLKVNLKKTKVMVSSSKGDILQSKVDPCAECDERVTAKSVMCTKIGKWVHG